MPDLIASLLIRGVALIFYFLPIRLILALGRFFGGIAYYLNPSRRRVAYSNLKAVFCEEKTPAELRRITKMVYRRLVETIFEVLALLRFDEKYFRKFINVKGKENIEKVAARGKGGIFLTAHFDNWEMVAMVSTFLGYPLVVLAREQSMKRVNELLNRLRESKKMTVVRKGTDTKNILKALHKGRMIGILGDQNAGKGGVFVNFFGRLTSTAPGTFKIAAKTGAAILPSFIVRKKGPYHDVLVEEPILVGKDEDIRPHVADYSNRLEKYIRPHPEQWLWLHKRWKATPTKKVLIISDGKPGHLNQAKALAEKLKTYRVKMDKYSESDTAIETVTPQFRSKFAMNLLKFCAFFSSRNCQGCMRCLKACLVPESYEELISIHCDVVISCGSSVAPVNRFVAVENSAKSAISMRPSVVGAGKFDMVVVPRHERGSKTNGNIIVTDITPNLIDKKYLSASAARFGNIADSRGRKRIGVLLGGDNKGFFLTEAQTAGLIEGVLGVSRKLGADILFTTSRRTPGNCEKIVKERLGKEANCRLLVLANENNRPDTVGGILSLSDIVIVSGESASMVSEAVSSGKPVVVFNLAKRNKKRSKFERMLKNLEEKKYIKISGTDNICSAIEENINKTDVKKINPELDDAYRYMWRLL